MLIVEDYPPARLMLSQQLQNNHHEVLVASNGKEGLALWQKHQAQIDVIITDCTMPEMDGFTMTRHIRQQEANERLGPVPILGLTAMSGFDATKTCLSSGMNTCLTKPLSPEELAQWVERHLHIPPS
ncbi:response regulator [Type-E symbiont of Plautia stali]|nr:response regulator [Type-E symbiont of Plautia stali]